MGGCVSSKKAVDGQQQPSKVEVVAKDEQVCSTSAADAHTIEPAPEQDPENENAPKTEESKGEVATQQDQENENAPKTEESKGEVATQQDPENETAPKTEESKCEVATQVKGVAAEMALLKDSADGPSAGGEPEEKDSAVNKTCGWLC